MSVGKWEWVESVGREHAEAEGVAAPHFPAVCGVIGMAAFCSG